MADIDLLIKIPEEAYKLLQNEGVDWLGAEHILNAVTNGTPLDSIKAEIAENICLTDNPYTKETMYTIEHLKLLDILDNIGEQKGVRRNDS